MLDPHSESLIHPLRRGHMEALPPDALLVGFGLTDPSAPMAHGGKACLVQGFRPAFLDLSASGAEVVPSLTGEGGRFRRALIRLGRHRGQNEAWLREAVAQLSPGGMIVAAGARTDGASSMRKRLAGIVPALNHAAVNHGEVFWFTVEDPQALGEQLPQAGESLIDGQYHTAPGMFSHAHVDPGSSLLAASLPEELGSAVADFGAGWGYLAACIAGREHPPAVLDLYEADFDSLEAARRNVVAGPETDIGFHWLDLVREKPQRRYDSIVMNPPFHTGRKAEPDLGSAMIRAAAAALKPDGRLFLVANRQLPYERILGESFSEVRELCVADGYKVIGTSRPVTLRNRAASVR